VLTESQATRKQNGPEYSLENGARYCRDTTKLNVFIRNLADCVLGVLGDE